MMLKLKLQYFGYFMRRVDSLEKTLMLGGIGGRRRRGRQDEMAGWHHQLDGREFEWTPGVGDGQGSLACCDSWGCKESDTTERLNWTELNRTSVLITVVYSVVWSQGAWYCQLLLFFLKIALTIQCLFYFHTHYKNFCSSSVKNSIGNLIQIALNQ